jgi:nucleoside-diphosphate-sugar epimerase
MSQKNRRVLVTGGAGFIGSHLVSRLLGKGYCVVVLDNLSSGKMENLAGVVDEPSFEFVRGDIRDREVVRKALVGVDAVAHLAALIDVSASVADPFPTHDVNVNGTLNVLHEVAKCRVGKFVLASSTAVYGDVKELPVVESAVLQPLSPYAASKAACEAYCCAFSGCFGVDTVRLRFFNVYGPRNEKNPYSGVISKFIRAALDGEVLKVEGDGEQTRDFVFVDDVVSAIVLGLESQNVGGEVFNVCTGEPISINGLVDAVGVAVGKELRVVHGPARLGDIRHSYGDGFKARRKLGFRSSTSLECGLKLLSEALKK